MSRGSYKATPTRDEETGMFRLDIDNPPTDSGSSSSSDDEERPRWHRLAHALLLAAVIAAVGLVARAVHQGPAGQEELRGLEAAAPAATLVRTTELTKLVASANATTEESAAWSLKPSEDLHDGNPCGSDEEFFKGLCYRKCSLLTSGESPIRTSAWSCCRSHPCGLSNQKLDAGKHIVCSGYDVAGDGSCPHEPGACLKDEELHLGVCYEKCEVLTNGEFPHRFSSATCCKTGGLGCLDISKAKTASAFTVGGGARDRDPSTPGAIHLPQQELTEASSTTGAPAGASTTPGSHPQPELLPVNGSACALEEELYGGLCYRKCNLLTYGEYPIRTSSWTCCKGHPCGLTNQKGSVGSKIICNGFDVAGDGSCPGAPKAACALDEEELLGVCYKKCSVLTKGAFPHRIAAATCCKTGGLGCFDIVHNVETKHDYDVGSEESVETQGLSNQAMVGSGSLMQLRK